MFFNPPDCETMQPFLDTNEHDAMFELLGANRRPWAERVVTVPNREAWTDETALLLSRTNVP